MAEHAAVCGTAVAILGACAQLTVPHAHVAYTHGILKGHGVANKRLKYEQGGARFGTLGRLLKNLCEP